MFEEGDGVVDIFVTVEGDEGAGEKFSDGLAGGEAGNSIAVAVFEDENTLQWGALRQSETSLTMPRGAVHENLPGIVAGPEFASRAFTNDYAVVAKDFDFV